MTRKLLATAVLVALVAGAFVAGRATEQTTASSPSTSEASPGGVTQPTGAVTTTTAKLDGVPRCDGAKIKTTIPSSAGAAGTVEATVRGVNLGSAPCGIVGYPGLQLQASVGGTVLPTTVQRGGSFSKPAAAGNPTAITVPPGGAFEFQLSYSNVPVGSETSCPSSGGLGVAWPGARATANLPYAATVCGNGALRVSRVYAA